MRPAFSVLDCLDISSRNSVFGGQYALPLVGSKFFFEFYNLRFCELCVVMPLPSIRIEIGSSFGVCIYRVVFLCAFKNVIYPHARPVVAFVKSAWLRPSTVF